jgi:hypothetical protein
LIVSRCRRFRRGGARVRSSHRHGLRGTLGGTHRGRKHRGLTMWNRSNRIRAFVACSRTSLAYVANISMHTTRSVRQRRRPISWVKNGLALALAPAHLVNANRVHWRPGSMAKAILNRPLHDGRHALPVQAVLTRRSLPTQLPGQAGHGVEKGRSHPSPRFGPRKLLHPHPHPEHSTRRGR